jgi:hypothetical protein
LNTKKDPHALSRNQLAVSVNGWYGTGNAFSKRPGNAQLGTVPLATGSGYGAQSMTSGRFANVTWLLVQSAGTVYACAVNGSSWTSIGSVAAGGVLRSAQLFDPSTSLDTMFCVDGKVSPRGYTGGGSFTTLTVGNLPKNHSGAAPITPKFVSTLFSHLFYAGEPTEPSAVYISDAFKPQSFTQNAIINPGGIDTGGTYIPYFVGRNDGISGGDITGLSPIGGVGAMIVYKQAAIYRGTQIGLQGDSVWQWVLVSASVGMVAPQSLVAFDTFHCFLGLDGVYVCDGSSVTRISDNVPTFFDSTLTGTNASILDRTTAVGVRDGQRYLLFFDDGGGASTAAGHPTTGVWFDFAHLDEDGKPTCGVISGMVVGGAVALRGPSDSGDFAWADAVVDNVGQFGVGYSDYGADITTSFAGKADSFDDIFGQDAIICAKHLHQAQLVISLPQSQPGEILRFMGMFTFDYLSRQQSFGQTLQVMASSGAIVGSSTVGTAIVGDAAGQVKAQPVRLDAQNGGDGHFIQATFTETSSFPWTTLGYVLRVNKRDQGGLDQ